MWQAAPAVPATSPAALIASTQQQEDDEDEPPPELTNESSGGCLPARHAAWAGCGVHPWRTCAALAAVMLSLHGTHCTFFVLPPLGLGPLS